MEDLLVFVLRVHLRVTVHLYVGHEVQYLWVEMMDIPEVLVIRNRAFVRFASSSMLSVPKKDVFNVLTESI